MNRTIVPLLLLLLCAFTLTAQPQQLPAGDFRITDSMPGFAANHRYDLRIATNGQNFLAAWIDERTGWDARRLIVTRLDRSGNALDGEAGTGIALGEPWNVAELSVASDGVDYLAVWRPIEGDVRLVRIDGASGAVTQLPSIDDSAMYGLSLLWAGNRYVLVHRTFGLESEVQALDLDRSGRPEAAVRTIVSATAYIVDFRVVSVGAGEILAVWSEEGGKTYARQITSPPANDVPVLVAESGVINALASSGSTALGVLSTEVEQQRQLSTLVLGANGAVVRGAEPAGEAVSTPQRTDVTWDGSRFRLVTVANDARSVRTVSYNANGGLLEGPRTLVTGEMYDVVAASAQGETLAVYTWRIIGSNFTLQVRAKNIAGSSSETFVSVSEPESALPTVVWLGDHYLSVWLDSYGDRTDAMYMAVNPDGTPRGPATRLASTNSEDGRLSVDTDGQKALIVWHERERGANVDVVQAMLIGDVATDTTPGQRITLADGSRLQSSIAVRWNGSEYLVTWATQQPHALYGMRIAPDGTKLDAQPVELVAERAFSRPAVAWNGTHWIVAYTAAVPRDPNAAYLEFDSYIHAVQLTRELTRTGATMRLSIAEPTPPRIAVRNGEALVVWGTTVESYEIYGARIVNGANLDGPTGFWIGSGSPTSVHASDSGYVVLELGGRGWTVQGRVASDPQKLFRFVPEHAQVDLVQGGPKPLVVYRAWPTGSEQVPRVRARYLTSPPRRRAAGH